MTKKITITISQDGTSNNKTDDKSNGTHSNVARLHEMVQADMSSDFSEHKKIVTEKLNDIHDGAAGSKKAFNNFLAQEKNNHTDTPLHIKIYQDGVASGPEGINASYEGGTGAGTAPRVKELRNAIIAIQETYGNDVEIELNAIGFSRGSVTIKQLLNEISAEYPNGEIHLNNVLLIDPVASIGLALTDTHMGMELHAPAIIPWCSLPSGRRICV